MATKKKKITRTVGHYINDASIEVAVKKQFYGNTKKECLEKYEKYLNAKNLGVETSKQYFGILADNWIYEFFINDSLKDGTKNLYISTWNKYIKPTDLYHFPLDKITPSTIQRTYNNLSCPNSALKTIHKLMRKFFKYLEREGLSRDLTSSLVLPIKKVEIKEKTIQTWSEEEIKIILSNFHKADERFRLRFFIILAYYTGARISELLALTYDDFTEKGIYINKQLTYLPTFKKGDKIQYKLGIDSPKTASSVRTIPMPEIIVKELKKHTVWHKSDMLANKYRTNYVFTTSSGAWYDDNNVRVALNRYYKTIGVPMKSPHVYRHTFATLLAKSGVRMEICSALLGHSDIRITAKYYVDISFDDKLNAITQLSKNIISS